MSGLENVDPNSKTAHSNNDALKSHPDPQEDTVVNLRGSGDTVHEADLNQVRMPAVPDKKERFEQVRLRVTIQEHSLKLVLGSKASSVTKKLVAHFSTHKDETTVAVNLRAHGKAFRLCVMRDDLTAEREMPDGPALMGVVIFKRVGNNIFLDTLQDVNGREIPPFGVIRNIVLAERAVEKTENKARQEIVHDAKFHIGLVKNRFDMPGNFDMQSDVQKMLRDLDSAMSSLLTTETASSSAENSKAWAKTMQKLELDLKQGIATVCPCIDAFLLAFDPNSQTDELRSLRDNADMKRFLDSITHVSFFDRSAEAGLKRKVRSFVEKLRAR